MVAFLPFSRIGRGGILVSVRDIAFLDANFCSTIEIPTEANRQIKIE